MASSDNTINILLKAQDEATATIKEAAKNIEAASDKISSSTKTVGAVSQGASEGTNAFASSLVNTADMVKGVAIAFATYQIGSAISDFVTNAVGSAASLEQSNMAFQSLIGNVADANSVFGQLVQYANVTPFQSKDIIQASQTLMGFGTAGQQTVDTIKQLGDIVSTSGGNLDSLSLVTGQIFSQGKMRAQDMYQVINDGGAGLVKIMAANAGGMDKLTAEFDTGGVTADQYFTAVKQATEQGGFAFDGAQKQANTFNGQVSTLEDSITQMGMKLIGVRIDPQLGYVIEPGGLFDRAKGIIQNLTAVVGPLGDKLTTWETEVSNHLGPVWNDFVKKIQEHKGDIEDIAKTIGEALVGALSDTFKILAIVMPPLLDFADWCVRHKQAVLDIAAAIVAIKVALAISDAIAAFQIAFAGGMAAAGADVGGLSGAITTMRALVSSPVGMGGIAVAGAIADIGLVYAAVQQVQSAIQAVNDAASAQAQAAQTHSELKGILQNILEHQGVYSPDKVAAAKQTWNQEFAGQKYALGTNFAPGGLALVGENGPELVGMPTGSRVYGNQQTQQMLGGSGKSLTIMGGLRS